MSFFEIKSILCDLGYNEPMMMWYKNPEFSTSTGLKQMECDADVCQMAEASVKNGRIDVYVEANKGSSLVIDDIDASKDSGRSNNNSSSKWKVGSSNSFNKTSNINKNISKCISLYNKEFPTAQRAASAAEQYHFNTKEESTKQHCYGTKKKSSTKM